MGNVILALLERPEAARPVLAAAQRLAVLTGAARIKVLAIRLPPGETILPTDQIMTHGREDRIRGAEGERVARLKAAFEPWAAAASELATDWQDIEANAESAMRECGSRADYIVMERPAGHPEAAERQAIHAALFETDRPVLMVPSDWRPAAFGRRVAIAWRDDPRTLKSVMAALRCLAQAERLDVIAGRREGAVEPRLPDLFKEHGITANLHVLPVRGQGTFGGDLLAKAHLLGSDLLVVGAFARQPWRSLVLGGVTRHMLAQADLPIFMRH